ncbi:exosome 3'-_5 exonuclease subunit ski4 (Csl4) [Agyrium rufum]|nr:exosome 3'->5 exonuclease subunit ski4 (Csl4) [Agyrium rufum]
MPVMSAMQLPSLNSSSQGPTCDTCGTAIPYPLPLPFEAQQRIEELEAQVKMLTMKATEAVERATDYEDALRALTSANNGEQSSFSPTHIPARPSTAGPLTTSSVFPPPPPTNAPAARTSLTRLFPSLRSNSSSSSVNAINHQATAASPLPSQSNSYYRPASLSSTTTVPAPPGSFDPNPYQNYQSPPPQQQQQPNTAFYENQLTQERQARLMAEQNLSKTQAEIEELTGQLFQEANEMVAVERKEKARLEEKVRELEGKGKRMEEMEGRLGRIERVRRLLGERGSMDGGGGGVVGLAGGGVTNGKEEVEGML